MSSMHTQRLALLIAASKNMRVEVFVGKGSELKDHVLGFDFFLESFAFQNERGDDPYRFWLCSVRNGQIKDFARAGIYCVQKPSLRWNANKKKWIIEGAFGNTRLGEGKTHFSTIEVVRIEMSYI